MAASLADPPAYGTEAYWYTRVQAIPDQRFHMQVWCCQKSFNARDAKGTYSPAEVGCGHSGETFDEIVQNFGLQPGVVAVIGGGITVSPEVNENYDRKMLRGGNP